ncbi:unnamed protein product [Effrenium voratum]|nr:unnamed protein product [Effrenium voratum]
MKRPLALMEKPANPAPARPGQFARSYLFATGALRIKRKGHRLFRKRLASKENPFPGGRLACCRALAAEAASAAPASASASARSAGRLMPLIWREWKMLWHDAGLSDPHLQLDTPEALGAFQAEATAALRRWRQVDRERVRLAVEAEWRVMPGSQKMLWAAVAEQRKAFARPPSPPRRPKRPPPKPADKELEPPCLSKMPSREELYKGGTDAAFAHPFVQELLSFAREKVAQRSPLGAEWNLCVRTFGRSGHGGRKKQRGIAAMTLAVLKELGLLEGELRRRVHIFVAHDDPDFVSGGYARALGELMDRVIVGVRGADLQVRFIEECFPRGQHVVVCDDNILALQHLVNGQGPPQPPDLDAVFLRARREMQLYGAHLWGISPTHNVVFVQNSTEVNTKLGLVYGAFFGFVCLHEKELYTQHGQVKDDLERSLRYWDRDRVVIRFGHLVCKKSHKPGAFDTNKGGISASLGGQGHQNEAQQALLRLEQRFFGYVRLPSLSDQKRDKSGDLCTTRGCPVWKNTVSNCGVVFLRRSAKPPEDGVLKVGYVCRACRQRSAKKWRCLCIDPLEREARRFHTSNLRGELLLAFPKTPGSPATPSRPVEAIVDFGYYEHWSKVCGSLHRFHVVVRCPKVLQEVTRDTATAQFERKQFSLLIRGAAKDYMLRRTVGARVAALPVSFPVCPDRCSLLVWPGRKVELVLRPYPPSWLQPGARVRVVRLETEDAQRLNGRQGTVQSFVEPEDKTSARYAVKMDSGTRLKLRPANLQLI